LLLLFGVVAAALNATNVGYVFFVRNDLHASATMYGLVEAAFAAGMPAGAWAVARLVGADRRLALGLAAVLAGLSAVVLASAGVTGVRLLIGLWLVGGVLNGALNVWFGVLLARRIPAAVRGRAFALVGAVGNGTATAGYLIGGAAIGLLPVRTTIGLAGLAGLVGIAILITPLRRAARSALVTPPAGAQPSTAASAMHSTGQPTGAPAG
jgi:MFS family permease